MTFCLTNFDEAGLGKKGPWRVEMSLKLVGTKPRQCPVSAGQRWGETSVYTTPGCILHSFTGQTVYNEVFYLPFQTSN